MIPLNENKKVIVSNGTKKLIKEIVVSDNMKKYAKGAGVVLVGTAVLALGVKFYKSKNVKASGSYKYKEHSVEFNIEIDDQK